MTEETKLESNQPETEDELESATEGEDPEATEEGEQAEGQEDEGEGEPTAPDAKDAEIEALKNKTREMDGRLGTERGQKNLLHKMVRKLEADGKLDRDEIANELGIERTRVDGIIDAKSVDDHDAYMTRLNWADKQLKSVASVLKASGKDAEVIGQTYGNLLRFNEAERQTFMELPEDELVAHILSRANEAEPNLRPLLDANGDVFVALNNSQKRVAELEAENTALKGGSQPKPKGQPKGRVPMGGGDGGAPKSAGAEFTSRILG